MAGYHNDKLLLLAHQLMPDDRSLAEEIDLAITHPDEYVVRFQERLDDRGIYEPVPYLPWIALLDGLRERGRLVEIDWKETIEEVIRNVDHLLSNQQQEAANWEWLAAEEWGDIVSEEFLKTVGDRLSERGLILASPDLYSDSYPLSLIEVDRFAESQRLVQQTGYGTMVEWSHTEQHEG